VRDEIPRDHAQIGSKSVRDFDNRAKITSTDERSGMNVREVDDRESVEPARESFESKFDVTHPQRAPAEMSPGVEGATAAVRRYGLDHAIERVSHSAVAPRGGAH
jgi:hypothetical protein